MNYQYSSIGSEYGLAPTRWKAIIWTNDDYFTDAYMRHWAPNKLTWILFGNPGPQASMC